MKKLLLFLVALFLWTGSSWAQVSGTKNIPGDYATLALAITDLNSVGVGAGGVTLNLLAANPQTAPVGGYSITTLTGSVANPIVIQGNGNTITAPTPQTAGSQTDAFFKIVGGDYITIQNFVMQENASNTVTALATNTMTEFGVAIFIATATDGAQNNTIQNNTITLGSTYQNAIGIFSTSSSSSSNGVLAATSTAGTNSSNKFYSNTISGVAYGMYFISQPLTATIFETGIDIGGSSLATANTITFGNATTATLTWTSFSATLPAGITFRNGGAGNTIRYNTITSNSLTYTNALGGIVTTIGTAATGVTYTSTRSNNTITLTNNGLTAITGIDFGYGIATGTIGASDNSITLNQTTSAAASAAIIGIKASYTSATNTLNTNAITVNQSPTTTGSLTSAVTGITAAGAGTTVNVNSNIITFKQNAPTGTATYGAGIITYIDCGAASGTVNVNSNQLLTTGSTIRSTGSCYGISHASGTITVGLTINLNTITIDRLAASGSVYGTYEATSPSTVAYTITNNAVTLTNLSGTSSGYGIQSLGGVGATGTSKNMNTNTINISGTNTGTDIGMQTGYSYGTINNNSVTIASVCPTVVAYQATGTGTGAYTMTGNSLSIASSTTSPTSMIGFNVGATGPFQIYSNTFTIMNFSGIITGSPTVSGIAVAAGTGNNIYSNVITNISVGAATSSGSPIVRGIAVTGGTSTNIYKNKIYGLATPSTGVSTLVSGITISAGTTNTVYNNLIGNLTATATANTDAIRGINITSTTSSSTNNIYYNTVYLNASSSGANFGTTGIYHTTSATATTSALNLRNNVIVNNSTAAGTGLTVAFRRSSATLTNYASTSNTNCLYATNIMHDGVTAYTTMLAYKTAVSPRDAASFSENPTFISTTGSSSDFLHIDLVTPTQIESGGVAIGGITDDYDGTVRNVTTPDIGADEGTFTGLDLSGPSISYTTLGNGIVAATRSFSSVTITDASGVNGTAGTRPRVYYKKSTETNTYVGNTSADNGWKYVEANGSSSPFDFTIDYSKLTSALIATDVIQYFVVAQDLAAAVNIGINSGTFNAAPTSVALTAGAFPLTGTINSYTIVGSISGTKTVGSGGDYATLTAALGLFADINSKVLAGNLTVQIISDITLEDGVNALNAPSEDVTGSNYTITIYPTGSARAISGSSAAVLIKLNAADRVTIDGSIGGAGTDKSLTISNTNLGATSGVLWGQSNGSDGCTNNTFKNLNISGNAPTTTLIAVGFGSSTFGTASYGTGNNNNTIQNCNISKAQIGIVTQGASAGSKNTGNVITQNLINTASPNNISRIGILVGYENNIQITQNNVDGMVQTSSTDAFGISLGITGITTSSYTGNEVTNATVSRNYIGTVRNTGTYSAAGILIPSATSGTNQISNNVITGVSANGTTGDFSVGILIGGGAGSTTQVYYNSVYMSGTLTGGSDKSYGIAIGGSDPIVDVRNNAVYNTQNNGTGLNYAICYGYSTFVNLTSNYNDFITTTGALYSVGATGSISTPTNRLLLSDLQTATSKDANSLSVDPQFSSTTNLTPNLGAPILAAGTPVSVTTDYTGVSRSGSTPSIGAYEAGADVSGPAIAYTTLGNTSSTANRTLSGVTITDASSVDWTLAPRIYYKKSGDANAFGVANNSSGNGWKYTTANVGSSPTNFTIDGSLLQSAPIAADIIQYFVVAQDLFGTPNVSASPSTGFVGTSVSAITTAPTSPNTYTIVGTLSGAVTVGTSGTYPTLTGVGGLFAAINSSVLTGNITATIISDIISETGANALNQWSEEGAGGYSLTINPDAAVLRTLSGTYAGGLIRLNGADRVIIDGNFGGSGKYLTFSNTNTSGSVILLSSLGAGLGASNNTIKNCTIKGGAINTGNYGISIGGATAGSTGADNDNNTIQSNDILKAYIGIWAQGSATSNPGLMDALSITGNSIGSGTGTDIIAHDGIMVANTTGSSISQNTVFGLSIASSTPVGVTLGTGTVSTTFTRNLIYNCIATGTGGYGARALYVNTGNSSSSVTIANNVIHTIGGDGFTGFSNSSPVGIYIDGITGGINLYYNSVYLSGALTYTSATLTAAILLNSATITNIDLQNNVFQNSMNNGITSGSKNYAIYSTSANTAFTNINYNDYFVSGAQGVLGFIGSDRTDLAGIQTGFGQNTNSISSDPLFTSTTNLTLQAGSPLNAAATPIGTVTTDYAGTTRDTYYPTIGAYEVSPTVPTWNGSVDADWTNGSNWTNGLPGSTSRIIIPSTATKPTLATAATVADVLINAGGVLNIAPGGQLTVSTSLNNNAGTSGLVIESTAAGTGSLMHNTNNVDAKIQRYLTGNSTTNGTYDFHLVSVPLNADVTANQFLGMYLYQFDPTTQLWVGMGNSTSTPLDNNQGFMVFYPNTNTTINFTGQLNNGSFLAATGTAGADKYSLVPNPYPSAIDWDAVSGWVKGNIQDYFYIWDGTTDNYKSWNAGDGSAGSSKIPVGQSFFVKSITSVPTLSMTNSVRVHAGQSFYKGSEETVPEVLHLKVLATESADELLVRFNEQADISRGFMDIDKLYGAETAPQIYSLSGNAEKLTTNALNHSTQTIVVPVGLEHTQDGQLEFVASGIESFASTVSIFLEDKLLNKMIDLKSNPSYTFTHSTSDEVHRFALHFRGVTSTGELAAKNYNIWSTIDHVNVHIPALTGQKAIVELYDLLGHQVLSQQVNLGSPTSIAIPQFNGMGIVKVISGGSVYSEKVFIQ